jgi:hypothetical protein
VTGRTASANFPVLGSPFQGSLSGTSDAFILELSNTGFAVYASFLGGTGVESSIAGSTAQGAVGAVAVDASNNAYLAGATSSTTGFPVTSAFTCCGFYGGGLADGFVAKVGTAPADFSVAASPTTISTTSGTTTAAITVTVSSVNSSYGQPVSLSCGNLPSKAVCHFTTTPVTPGSSAVTSSLTIATNGAASTRIRAAAIRQKEILAALLVPVLGIVVLGAGVSSRRKRFFGLMLISLTLAGLLMLPSCSGGGGGGGGNTCTTVPSAPTGLAASSTTSTGTTLNWTAATAGTNCSVTGYTIYQNATNVGSSTTTNFAVTGLTASTTYSFTVAASDSAGMSAQSSPLSVTTGAGGTSGTPPGTYTITVTGSAGGVAHSAAVTLTVN